MSERVIQGDCLEVLGEMSDGLFDLIYVDPPFFTGKDWGEFDDRWESLDAYIDWVRQRAVEWHRVLSDTGSLFLHCDTSANAYLRVMLDEVFGYDNLRNEIVWCYTGPTVVTTKQFPRKTDSIFWYSKADNWTFNKDQVRVPYNDNSIVRSQYPNSRYGDRDPDVITEKGKIVENWWSDIAVAVRSSKERVGYPTQKPVKLLERIIRASTNSGDKVLDPMCGSGTTLVAARKLDRDYVGIDINPEAVALSKQRLAPPVEVGLDLF